MVKFKEKIIKNGSNKNIFHPVKRENEKVLRIKHKSNESNSAVDINNALFFLLDSVSLPLAQQMCNAKKKGANLYDAIDSQFDHNISPGNYNGMNYLLLNVAASLSIVNIAPITFEDLAIN